MQLPNIAGVVLGLVLIAFGVWIGLASRGEKNTKSRVFYYVTLFYFGAVWLVHNVLLIYPPSWSWEGIASVWIGWFAEFIVPVAVGFIILLIPRVRALGYSMTLLIIAGLMVFGKTL